MPGRAAGCLLGLAAGDAWGAPREGRWPERLLWRLIGRTRGGKRRWTDDTQMSLDLAESLLACGRLDPDDLARRFAAGYRWSRGYGPGTARVLKRLARGEDWRTASRAVHAGGSFGNGAAMRAPVIGIYWAARPAKELVEAARLSAAVTHSHPLGIEGAVLLARATALALAGRQAAAILGEAAGSCAAREFLERLDLAGSWLREPEGPGPKEVVLRLGNGLPAAESCVTALYAGLRFLERPFAELLAFLADCGGDVDTLGAMAGAVWGAARGAEALPGALLEELEQRERLERVAGELEARLIHEAQGFVNKSG